MVRVLLTDARLLEAKEKAILEKKRELLTDTKVEGIRVYAFPSGEVTIGVAYRIPGIETRMEFTFGKYPEEIRIPEARKLALIVRTLADNGIDVHEGLKPRLMKELRRDGLDWRCELSPPAPKRVPPFQVIEPRIRGYVGPPQLPAPKPKARKRKD